MIKSAIYLTLVLVISTIVSLGQTPDQKLESVQKALEMALVKDAPQVMSVRFGNCNATIKIERSAPYSAYSSNRSGDTAIARSGFMRDESSAYLSSGDTGGGGVSVVKETITVDFSRIDAGEIRVSPPSSYRFSLIEISGKAANNTISVTHRKTTQSVPRISFLVKNKAADKVAKAFHDVIERCTDGKHRYNKLQFFKKMPGTLR